MDVGHQEVSREGKDVVVPCAEDIGDMVDGNMHGADIADTVGGSLVVVGKHTRGVAVLVVKVQIGVLHLHIADKELVPEASLVLDLAVDHLDGEA